MTAKPQVEEEIVFPQCGSVEERGGQVSTCPPLNSISPAEPVPRAGLAVVLGGLGLDVAGQSQRVERVVEVRPDPARHCSAKLAGGQPLTGPLVQGRLHRLAGALDRLGVDLLGDYYGPGGLRARAADVRLR